MKVPIKGKSGNEYDFDVYDSQTDLEDRSGVYAILSEKNGKLKMIDVGEASEVKTRIEAHDRKDCWKRNCNNIKYAVYYIEHGKKPSRVEVEKDIRNYYNIPCGEW